LNTKAFLLLYNDGKNDCDGDGDGSNGWSLVRLDDDII
jgi:hypothetical protein